MRQFNLAILFGLLAATATAQTTKGNWMFGSTVGISNNAPLNIGGSLADNHAGVNFLGTTSKSGNVKETINSTLVSVAPAVGYFLADRLMVGFNVNFSFFSAEGNNKLTLTTLAPQVRYYFNQESKIRPFGEVRGGILFVKETGQERDAATLLGARGGAAIFLNEKVSLDIFLDYANTTLAEDTDRAIPKTTNSAFGLGVGFSFFL